MCAQCGCETLTPIALPSCSCADKLTGYLYTSIHPEGLPTVKITMCPTGARVALTSQLDTYSGQSGSPVYSANSYVRGVHSGSGGGKTYHAPVDKTTFQFIQACRQ